MRYENILYPIFIQGNALPQSRQHIMAKNQTTTVFCIHCSFKTFPPFIIYVLSESFLQFIFYNTCSLFM